jgi:molybdopterin converting factor small subunit
MARVTIEFFGVPRRRAGVPALTADAATAAEALKRVAERCPELAGVVADGRLNPLYLLSLNGERFVTDLTEPLPPGTRLLLLSADAGG